MIAALSHLSIRYGGMSLGQTSGDEDLAATAPPRCPQTSRPESKSTSQLIGATHMNAAYEIVLLMDTTFAYEKPDHPAVAAVSHSF